MSAMQQPPPERHGDYRQRGLVLALVDRWARLAVERPWRYAATWAMVIGTANFGLRMLLNDLSLARNASLAILTAVGFSVFAWLYTVKLTLSLRRQRPRPVTDPTVPKQRCAAPWRTQRPGRLAAAWGGPRSQRLWSCPRHVEAAARRGGRPPTQSAPRRRRLVLAAVAVIAITLALLVGAVTSRSAAPAGGHDVVVPSWRD
jgi:hypothetical protein